MVQLMYPYSMDVLLKMYFSDIPVGDIPATETQPTSKVHTASGKDFL